MRLGEISITKVLLKKLTCFSWCQKWGAVNKKQTSELLGDYMHRKNNRLLSYWNLSRVSLKLMRRSKITNEKTIATKFVWESSNWCKEKCSRDSLGILTAKLMFLNICVATFQKLFRYSKLSKSVSKIMVLWWENMQ